MTALPSILLVEDNPSDIELTRRALARNHISNPVVVIRDGQSALDYFFNEGSYAGTEPLPRPALTLLDLKLPKIDGIEVLRRLRSDSRTRCLPVVILTSFKE
ncbi:MAG: response regulator [Candidatus Synoicihabitans palmerolidicus]|nr:response regulator [Candidatus Synoicihabitans palmerolidicus]